MAVTIKEILKAPAPEALARVLRNRRGFFYLDSARHEKIGRGSHSFIGFEPFLNWRAKGDRITVESNGLRTEVCMEPLLHLRDLMARYSTSASSDIPFHGGAVGYFGYEFGARGENIYTSLPGEEEIPDAQFGFYDGLIAYDLASGKAFAVANPVGAKSAEAILSRMQEAVGGVTGCEVAGNDIGRRDSLAKTQPISNMTREGYLERVEQVKKYIAAGDVYQVNLSQRFELATLDEPYAIYQRLRALSPAPFSAYLDAGGFQILSSSPELLLRIDAQGQVVTRPIKGTRPRGRTPEEDQLLSAELLASSKDHAELLMIVDLERNDLGRVCQYGSIQVNERHRLETHPTVFHLVATISGQLGRGTDVFDCLRSMLPGGSITGAPKIRAMQIINELEPCRRDIYTGAIGYLNFDGTCDLNLAIRTIVCHKGLARYHVGGGIVADSDPENEYQETIAKGRAMHAALLGTSLS